MSRQFKKINSIVSHQLQYLPKQIHDIPVGFLNPKSGQ